VGGEPEGEFQPGRGVLVRDVPPGKVLGESGGPPGRAGRRVQVAQVRGESHQALALQAQLLPLLQGRVQREARVIERLQEDPKFLQVTYEGEHNHARPIVARIVHSQGQIRVHGMLPGGPANTGGVPGATPPLSPTAQARGGRRGRLAVGSLWSNSSPTLPPWPCWKQRWLLPLRLPPASGQRLLLTWGVAPVHQGALPLLATLLPLALEGQPA